MRMPIPMRDSLRVSEPFQVPTGSFQDSAKAVSGGERETDPDQHQMGWALPRGSAARIEDMPPTAGYTMRKASLIVRIVGFSLVPVSIAGPSRVRMRVVKRTKLYGLDLDSRERTDLPNHAQGQCAVDTGQRDACSKRQ